MINDRNDITVITNQVLWPRQMETIVRNLFDLTKRDVDRYTEWEIEIQETGYMITVNLDDDTKFQAIGVFFTVSMSGTQIDLIDGGDNETMEPTLTSEQITTLDSKLTNLVLTGFDQVLRSLPSQATEPETVS